MTHLRSFVAVLDQADGRSAKLNNVEQQRQTTVEFIAEDEEVRQRLIYILLQFSRLVMARLLISPKAKKKKNWENL